MFRAELFPDGTNVTKNSDAHWNNECRFPHQLPFDEQVRLRVPGCLWRRYERVPITASAMPGSGQGTAGTSAAKVSCRLCMKENFSFQCWLCTNEQCKECEGGDFLQKTSMCITCSQQEDIGIPQAVKRFQCPTCETIVYSTKDWPHPACSKKCDESMPSLTDIAKDMYFASYDAKHKGFNLGNCGVYAGAGRNLTAYEARLRTLADDTQLNKLLEASKDRKAEKYSLPWSRPTKEEHIFPV